MEAGEFFDKVEAHPDLEGVGIEESESDGDGDAAVYVRHVPTDSKYRVDLEAIGGQSWETLETVFLGKREPKVLSHMTRVVGYFSKVENWNRSKVGELKGRQRGDYSVKSE
jgi:hypothetical protein